MSQRRSSVPSTASPATAEAYGSVSNDRMGSSSCRIHRQNFQKLPIAHISFLRVIQGSWDSVDPWMRKQLPLPDQSIILVAFQSGVKQEHLDNSRTCIHMQQHQLSIAYLIHLSHDETLKEGPNQSRDVVIDAI